MNDHEWEILLDKLKIKKYGLSLLNSWHKAIGSGKNEFMKDYCFSLLNDIDNSYIHLAICYLGHYYPEFNKELIYKFKESTNADVLFSIALLTNDEQKMMEFIIKAYDYADIYDHQIHEGLEYMLYEHGTINHLKYFENKLLNSGSLNSNYKIAVDILKGKFKS